MIFLRSAVLPVRLLPVLAALCGGLLLTSCGSRSESGATDIEVLCAAGLRVPVEEAAKAWEAEGRGRIRLQFGGSQSLLSVLEVSRQGDVYLPADISYVEAARAKGLVAESIDLTTMTAVLAVRKGNPRELHSMEDLLRDGVRVVLANPELAAVSRLTAQALPPETWQALVRKSVALKPTVSDVAGDIVLGAADAGIVWDATVRQMPELEAVEVSVLRPVTGRVTGAVAGNRTAAGLKFLRWLAAPDKGGAVMKKHGYSASGGDPWEETPVLTLHAGAMLRPAIEPTLTEFEKSEDCRIERIYNGCGILVGQMKAGGAGDLFFACDVSFMDQVTDLFPQPVEVSSNRLVILVQKGNPHGIRSLADLGRPGIRIGVGHEKQCALGVLTQQTLTESGTLGAVTKNIVVQVPAGDMLVNQMLAGGLDAAVTYLSNAAGNGNQLEAIAVDLPCAVARQPLALSKSSRFPQLAARLAAALRSAKSKERFAAFGFGWKEPAAAP